MKIEVGNIVRLGKSSTLFKVVSKDNERCKCVQVHVKRNRAIEWEGPVSVVSEVAGKQKVKESLDRVTHINTDMTRYF